MTQQTIITTSGSADNAPTAAGKINANFTEVMGRVGKLKSFLLSAPKVLPHVVVTTTLNADIVNTDTTITVPSAAGFPSDSTFIATLSDGTNTEYVKVTAGMGTKSWTVTRGYNAYQPWYPTGTCTISNASPAVISIDNTLVAGERVYFTTTGALPTGLTANTQYYVIATGLGTSSFQVSATLGGAAINTSSAGSGTHTVKFAGGFAAATPTTITYVPLAHQKGRINDKPFTEGRTFPSSYTGTDPATALSTLYPPDVFPMYFTQDTQLAYKGTVLTSNLASSGATQITVVSTADFPQTGTFDIWVASEIINVSVLDATHFTITGGDSGRAQHATSAAAYTATNFVHVKMAEITSLGTSMVNLLRVSHNSGDKQLAMSCASGGQWYWNAAMALSMHFIFDGASFDICTYGNISFLFIADGQIMHSANALVESAYAGTYYHRFDFGSRKVRKITVLSFCAPAAVSFAATDTMVPWDRSQEPTMSMDMDSFGSSVGYTWSTSVGGTMGQGLELMLDLGITSPNFAWALGGTGYFQEVAGNPQAKMNGLDRLPDLLRSDEPTIMYVGLGHNDVNLADPAALTKITAYYTALRAGFPNTVIVACQYWSAALGAASPNAYLPVAAAAAQDLQILAALQTIDGPWVHVNGSIGVWTNSAGVTGAVNVTGVPFITGTGYAGATTGVGNGDIMIDSGGVHPTTLGTRYLGIITAAGAKAGILAL